MRRARSERGLSLVEATLVVMIVAGLATVVAPTIGAYLEDARQVAATHDAQAIGSGILQLLKDTGSRCLRENGANDCTKANRVDLLVSGGEEPRGIDLTLAPDATVPDSDAVSGGGTLNWLPDGDAPGAGQQDTIDNQLVENDNPSGSYALVSFTGGGPRVRLGWRGPYVTGPITSDPWGAMYQANTVFLTVATNATDGAGSPDDTQEGLREAGWRRSVLVLSAGSNGLVETPFGASGTSAGGDDVIYVLGGATR